MSGCTVARTPDARNRHDSRTPTAIWCCGSPQSRPAEHTCPNEARRLDSRGAPPGHLCSPAAGRLIDAAPVASAAEARQRLDQQRTRRTGNTGSKQPCAARNCRSKQTSGRRERRSWRGTHNSRPRRAGSTLNRCNDRISNAPAVRRDVHCAAMPKWWRRNNSATKNVIIVLSARITPSRSATTTRSTTALGRSQFALEVTWAVR